MQSLDDHIRKDNLEGVKNFLAQYPQFLNAKVVQKNQHGHGYDFTIIDAACLLGSIRILKYLVDTYHETIHVDDDTFLNAIANGNRRQFQMLIQMKGFDVNSRLRGTGETLVEALIQTEDYKSLKVLLADDRNIILPERLTRNTSVARITCTITDTERIKMRNLLESYKRDPDGTRKMLQTSQWI